MNNFYDSLIRAHELWEETLGMEGKKLVIREQDLSGANLTKKNLTNCAFLDVRIDNSDLSKADLAYSNLCYSSFKQSNLSDVSLVKAEADHAIFEGANLTNLNAFRATFIGASFRGAILKGVNFRRSLLDDADFTDTTISDCRFFEADLSRVNGLGSVKLDWIDVGPDDSPQKLYGEDGISWLIEASKK
jgi:uncharacterized protein YjbI with pentapeptide repeats